MSEMDVVLSKINIIKNCIMALEKATLREKDPDFLISIYELNLQRAIQACIDLANVVIAKEGLGLPNSYRQSFELLNNKYQLINSGLKKFLNRLRTIKNKTSKSSTAKTS